MGCHRAVIELDEPQREVKAVHTVESKAHEPGDHDRGDDPYDDRRTVADPLA